jgi:hypothetical protein
MHLTRNSESKSATRPSAPGEVHCTSTVCGPSEAFSGKATSDRPPSPGACVDTAISRSIRTLPLHSAVSSHLKYEDSNARRVWHAVPEVVNKEKERESANKVPGQRQKQITDCNYDHYRPHMPQHAQTHTHTDTDTDTHTHTHTHNIHTHTHTHTQTHTHARTHTRTHTHIRTHTHALARATIMDQRPRD